MSPSTIKKAIPAVAVSGVLLLSFLLPTSGQILGSLVGYGYGTVIRDNCCVVGIGASNGPGPGEDLFVRGNDNGIWQEHWNGTGFTAFVPLGGQTPNAPAAAFGTSNESVFINGMDGQLWQNMNGTGWAPKGGGLTAGPAVNLRLTATHSIDIFIRGLDGALYYRTSADDGVTLGGWSFLGGLLRNNPASTSWSATRIDVFIEGADSQLWHKWWDGVSWSGWQPLGGILTDGPAVTSCQVGHLDIVALGADHHTYYHMGWNGSAYTGWSAVPGQYNSAPTISCSTVSAGTIDIFGEGLDNYLWWVSEPAS